MERGGRSRRKCCKGSAGGKEDRNMACATCLFFGFPPLRPHFNPDTAGEGVLDCSYEIVTTILAFPRPGGFLHSESMDVLRVALANEDSSALAIRSLHHERDDI